MLRSFHSSEIKVDIVILIAVTTKQKRINLISHTSEKSTVASCSNSNTGSGTKNTNLFIFTAKTSSIHPSFLNNIPSNIIKKIGIVAFKLKIKFSIIVPHPTHLYLHIVILNSFQKPVNSIFSHQKND